MAAQVFWAVFFIPADGQAKLAQQLISTVLPFHPLYFPWEEKTFNLEYYLFELSNIPFHYHMLFPHIRHKKVKVFIKLHLLFFLNKILAIDFVSYIWV